MKILKEAQSGQLFGTRTRWIKDIVKAYVKFPESRNVIKLAYEKVTKETWDNDLTVEEMLAPVNTEDLRYIYDQVIPKYSGGGSDTPSGDKVIDFSFSVKVNANGKSFDIIDNRDVLNKRTIRVGSSIVGVKEFITDWIDNELNA